MRRAHGKEPSRKDIAARNRFATMKETRDKSPPAHDVPEGFLHWCILDWWLNTPNSMPGLGSTPHFPILNVGPTNFPATTLRFRCRSSLPFVLRPACPILA